MDSVEEVGEGGSLDEKLAFSDGTFCLRVIVFSGMTIDAVILLRLKDGGLLGE